MRMADALQIVLDLARQNVIDIREDATEHARQMEACDTIEDLAVNQFGCDYIEPSRATAIRIFDEGFHWSIDAIDEHGNYTEKVWTHYDGKELTRESAISVAHLFAAEIGCEDLPVIVVDAAE